MGFPFLLLLWARAGILGPSRTVRQLEAQPLRCGRAGPGGRLAPDGGRLRAAFGDVPGSLLDVASVAAAPDEFVWHRWTDLLASLGDPAAFLTHLRVSRWALDEFPFPGRLFEHVLERLYRRDAFARGELVVGGRRASPDRLTMPMLHVLDPRSRVVAPSSVVPVHQAAPSPDKPLLRYHGEPGVGFQHVGVLVGRRAHAELWPELLAWLGRRRARQGSGG
jgi:polyhydroxyalkanoate synthase